ncbi:hypothetical protein AVEN_65467-1, partial [Araneus ventricosus]
MDTEALIAERLLAWDRETDPLAPLSGKQLKVLQLLSELPNERPFPTD